MTIVRMLQRFDYNKWTNIAVVVPEVERDENVLRSLAIESVTLDKYYNTTAKRFQLLTVNDGFAHYYLKYRMKPFSTNSRQYLYDDHYLILRIVDVNADTGNLDVGGTPDVYPPYSLTYTDVTMRQWINNEALTPEFHLIRCVACVLRDNFGSHDRNSRDAFGLYALDNSSSEEYWLIRAKKYAETHTEDQMVTLVTQYLVVQREQKALSGLFEDVNYRDFY